VSGLTSDEQKFVEMVGNAWVLLCKIVGDGPTRDADLAEACNHIHALQHTVMAQAAGRAHPGLYRLLGESLR
jgi:hypothetical protein